MSDPKSDNKELMLLVESIATKINGAPALNGGFDRMLVLVEHIQDKQEETCLKVDKIHEALYEPKDGLYARVKMVETATADFASRQAAHLAIDEKNIFAINESLKKLDVSDHELARKTEITEKLKKVAGDDLEKLGSIIKIKSLWSELATKAAWLVVGGVLVEIGKTVWELVKGH
jgi:hypothetical protein